MFRVKFKIYFLLFICLLNVNLTYAQLGKEAWHWQFGFNCALDFSSGIPISSSGSAFTSEGTASISDSNSGQLLFYTDGTFVYDRYNNQMPNGQGLFGNITTTQSALIIPKPNNSNIYYIVTCGDQGNLHGVCYSIVDMSLNSGHGDVVSSSKNTSLTPGPTTEKLIGIKHCNDRDYWIIDHKFNSNTFNAYLVTSNGINPIPVTSNIGTAIINNTGTGLEAIGYLKASPNGKKLANAVTYMQFLELYDFDNSTGMISNPIKITDVPKRFYPYGVSFSPNNSKLFVSASDSLATVPFSGKLFEYDLSNYNYSNIISSRIYIPSDTSFLYLSSALQLGPDNKIYSPSPLQYFMSVINNPNDTGINCHYHVGKPNTYPGLAFYGLPNFIDANKINPAHKSTKISLCTFSTYTLFVSGGGNYQWSTGDTTTSININTFGNYSVSYFNTNGCKEIDSFNIVKVNPPVVNVLHDTIICNNSFIPLMVNATDTNATSFSWYDGDTTAIRTFTIPGTYWVNYFFTNFCISKDAFYFGESSYPPLIYLGNDTSFCLGQKKLNAYTSGCTYLWNTGETSSSIIATHAGDYWVAINNNGCKTYDSLTIYPDYSVFDFVMPNIVTPNNDGINDFIDFGKYQFSSLKMEIYNRWGKLVFESIDPTIIWKPTEEDGAYFYTLQYHIDCGKEIQGKSLKGVVTIIR